MAGVAGLEPVTSAVTGQRSNQLSYTPAMGNEQSKKRSRQRQGKFSVSVTVMESVPKYLEKPAMAEGLTVLPKIRAADAKEVGVGNPAEETCCHPNKLNVTFRQLFVNRLCQASLGFTSPDFAVMSLQK